MLEKELKRQTIHLIFGAVLALIVLALPKDLALAFFIALTFIGLFVSDAIQKRYHIPIFSWFIRKFERKNTKPGAGVILTFFGIIISLMFFDKNAVFAGLIILAFGDSFSAVVGKAFGKTRVACGKTLEGSVAFFIAAFLASALYLPLQVALIASLVGALVELIPINDNLTIPPAVSLAIYILAHL